MFQRRSKRGEFRKMSIGNNELITHAENCEECMKREGRLHEIDSDSEEYKELADEIYYCWVNSVVD